MSTMLGTVSSQDVFDFPGELINWFHGVAQPGTTFCVEYLRVPTEIAPSISIAVLVFCPLYFLGMLVFGPSCLGYTGTARWEMSSCVPSFVHGATSSYVAIVYVLRHWRKYGFIDNDMENRADEVALIQFSCAYFIEDLFLFLLFYAPHEILFACHHIAVLMFMKVALFLGFGSISSVVSISMGEITSPLQNLWFWLKYFRYTNKTADEAFAYVSWIYSAFYIFIRSFFGVAVMGYCVYRVTQTKKYPAGAGIVLALMLVGGVAASQTWCWKLSKRLRHPYRPAYGTQPKQNGEHIDNYTPEPSSTGTGSSSGTASTDNGGPPFLSAVGKAQGASTAVGSSFPLTDQGLSAAAQTNGKKVL